MSTVKLILAELRKEKGVTQSELANFLGVSFQSVSKWENGTTMPDITLLPKIAEYFQVSVDEILGLKPLRDREYISRGTDSKDHWNNKLSYLKNSRILMWNDDYLEFLVNRVWKINKPVNIIDFGCGYGYLGMVLLPILPKGSTYTGVDISDTLLSEAKTIFAESEYKTEFIECDLNLFSVKGKYDIAICQALLRHLPNPKDILKKMVDSVTVNGMVICIEVNREFENAGLYIKGMEYNSFGTTAVFQKLWKNELAKEGRDYSIGLKVPFYMQECGLYDIDIRINDKVNLINPYENKNEYSKLFNSLLATKGWNRPLSHNEKESIINHFMNRGLTRAEAEIYVKAEVETSQYLMENKENVFALSTLCLLVSYGTKKN